MRRWLSIVTLVLIGFAHADAAFADRRVALIVANGDYKNAPLANPPADADLVAASLEKIGFSVQVAKNADLDAFDGAVNAFAETAKGADIALFYFAGHGFTVIDGFKPVSVLMSTSANLTTKSERVLRAGGLPLDDIAASLVGRAKVTLVFVDACRKDARIVRAVGEQGRGFAPLAPVQGGSVFIGLSTRLGATAGDGVAGRSSPFARAFAANVLVQGMRIDDMFRQVRDAVSAETDGAQLPDIVQDDLPKGAITLVEPPSAPATPVASLETGAVANEEAAKALAAECDRLAASPTDAARPRGIDGVEFEHIDAARAVPACQAAVAADHTNEPRLTFQLARGLDKAGGAEAQAVSLYRKSADAGYAPGMNNLGIMYDDGIGVSKDPAEAIRWYRKAADAGDARGMKNLGLMYAHGTGVAKDPAEAVRWYRNAADAGDAGGMTNLGLMYAHGTGVAKDPAEAVRWYRKAADAGEALGMNNLGFMYENGTGVAKDLAEAVRWYRNAADAGDPTGMAYLGEMYEHGKGVTEDLGEATSWLRKAADLGNEYGKDELKKLSSSPAKGH